MIIINFFVYRIDSAFLTAERETPAFGNLRYIPVFWNCNSSISWHDLSGRRCTTTRRAGRTSSPSSGASSSPTYSSRYVHTIVLCGVCDIHTVLARVTKCLFRGYQNNFFFLLDGIKILNTFLLIVSKFFNLDKPECIKILASLVCLYITERIR